MGAAFDRLGAKTNDVRIEAVLRASRLSSPRVGRSPRASRPASERPRVTDSRSVRQGTGPCICLGLQVLCDSSEESPGVDGLGVLNGVCQRLPDEARVPHLGWNTVTPEPGCRILATMDGSFANSFALRQAPPGWNAAWTTHGVPFIAAVERGPNMRASSIPSCPRSGFLTSRARLTSRQAPVRPHDRAPVRWLCASVPCLDVQDGRVVKAFTFANCATRVIPPSSGAL